VKGRHPLALQPREPDRTAGTSSSWRPLVMAEATLALLVAALAPAKIQAGTPAANDATRDAHARRWRTAGSRNGDERFVSALARLRRRPRCAAHRRARRNARAHRNVANAGVTASYRLGVANRIEDGFSLRPNVDVLDVRH